MALTLGRRIGLLAPIFELPRLSWTQQKIADRLNALGDDTLGNLDPQVLSRAFSGTGPDRLEKSPHHSRIIAELASLLDQDVKRSDSGFWDRHHTSRQELERELAATDAEFLRYLARVADAGQGEPDEGAAVSAGLPILPSVSAMQRDHAVLLHDRLGGKCFLYRLGVESRTRKRQGKTVGSDNIVVLRRLPVLIEDTGRNYLTYRDRYSFYQEEPEDDWAEGYMFYTKEYYTIVAADYDPRGITELFLVQLKDDPLRKEGQLKDIGDIFEGLMVMNGDLRAPTACKVLFRRAPEEFQAMEWEAFAEAHQMKLDLKQLPNGTYDVARAKDPQADFDGLPYSFFANRLQIRETEIDIVLR